jgi:hypothetical protein
MSVQLSNLASAVARKPIKVKAGDVGSPTMTDGKTMQITPPFALGLDIPHVNGKCNRYDSTGKSLCPACAVHEDVLAKIYHEMGHILGNSFKENFQGKTANQLAYAESQWLPMVLNQIEDARCNSLMVAARPGLKRILGQTILSFRVGEVPIISRKAGDQLLMAYMIDSEDFEQARDEEFGPEVQAIRKDPEYWRQVNSWRSLASAQESLAAAREFVKLGKKHGFFLDQEDFEKNEDQEDKGDDSPESDPDQQESKDESEPSAGDEADTPDSGEGSDDAESEEGEGESRSDDSSSSDDDSQDGDAAGDKEAESSQESGTEGESQSDAADESAAPGSGDGMELDEPSQEGDSGDSPSSGDDAGDGDGDAADTQDSGGDASEGSPGGQDGEGNQDGDQDAIDAPNVEGSGSLAASSTGTGDADTDGPKQDDQDRTDSPLAAQDAPQDGPTDGTPEPSPDEPDPEPYEPAKDWQEYVDRHGSPEELKEIGENLTGHEDKDEQQNNKTRKEEQEEEAVQKALEQFQVFDGPSFSIDGLIARKHSGGSWKLVGMPEITSPERALSGFNLAKPGMAAIMPNAQRMRYIFAENDRSKNEPHLKRGKVNTRVLGKRAPLGDERLFQKKTHPKRRDYAVIIGIDISGSTNRGHLLRDEKIAVWAQMKLLEQIGVPFAVYAHSSVALESGQTSGSWRYDMKEYQGIWIVKELKDRLDEATVAALVNLPSTGGNLDGHAMEYLRKRAQESRATDRMIMYFSDGAMLNNNSVEERAIMEREVEICKRDKIALAAVGVSNNDPARYGFPMVRYDSVADIPLVVQHIATRLEAR